MRFKFLFGRWQVKRQTTSIRALCKALNIVWMFRVWLVMFKEKIFTTLSKMSRVTKNKHEQTLNIYFSWRSIYTQTAWDNCILFDAPCLMTKLSWKCGFRYNSNPSWNAFYSVVTYKSSALLNIFKKPEPASGMLSWLFSLKDRIAHQFDYLAWIITCHSYS